MRLLTHDPTLLTLDLMLKMHDELYYITPNEDGKMELVALDDKGIFSCSDKEHLLVQIIAEKPKVIPDEVSTPIIKEPRRYEARGYKLESSNKDKTIHVATKPDGTIRVSFVNKSDAETFFDVFRERFYKARSHVDFITIDTIYNDLDVVNSIDTDIINEWRTWGYPTLEGGRCTCMSPQVNITKGTRYWGFTLGKPKRIVS